YTLSRSWDDGSAQRDVIPNAFDASNLWGPSTFDTRHVMVLNTIYQLPFLRGNQSLAGRLLGGWTVTAVTQFQSGTPFTVATNDDFAGVGTGSGSQIWNVNGPIVYDRQFSAGAGRDSSFWFRPANQDNSALFTRPAANTFTTQSNRGIAYNPGFQNWNLSVFKDFRIVEGHMLQFRAEAFNWINHPNWDGASTNPTSAEFGRVTGKASQRNLQFVLRYSF
ncbi:MAG: TonB-dependent receptor, partial [Bryobacteraceae bacterium]